MLATARTEANTGYHLPQRVYDQRSELSLEIGERDIREGTYFLTQPPRLNCSCLMAMLRNGSPFRISMRGKLTRVRTTNARRKVEVSRLLPFTGCWRKP